VALLVVSPAVAARQAGAVVVVRKAARREGERAAGPAEPVAPCSYS
jgi:hypothetical protein